MERRCNEPDGRVRWVDETEVNGAAARVRPDPPPEPEAAPAPAPEPRPAAAGARPDAGPPPALSARDVRCPQCGEEDELSGRRTDGEILLTCHTCDADGLAAALAHGGAVLPKELPTVGPRTLRELGRGAGEPSS